MPSYCWRIITFRTELACHWLFYYPSTLCNALLLSIALHIAMFIYCVHLPSCLVAGPNKALNGILLLLALEKHCNNVCGSNLEPLMLLFRLKFHQRLASNPGQATSRQHVSLCEAPNKLNGAIKAGFIATIQPWRSLAKDIKGIKTRAALMVYLICS